MGTRFSYHGATAAYGGGGDKFFNLANLLKKCGYDVCILKDSDCADNKEQYSKAKGNRIPIFEWEAGNAIEEQIFSDVSISCINELIELVIDTKSFDHVKSKLKDCLAPISIFFDGDAESVVITEHISHEERKTLGKVAKHKKSEWFKRIGLGEQVGDIIFSHYNDVSKDSRLVQIIEGIQDWVSAQ
ncbi:hypothetical protein NQU17_04750 [Clostridiaceae bacterium HFYG-1003]|nr:hypothetical protein NQU17_04750 [Clostridiaceae bacterium HFYG-1003]